MTEYVRIAGNVDWLMIQMEKMERSCKCDVFDE